MEKLPLPSKVVVFGKDVPITVEHVDDADGLYCLITEAITVGLHAMEEDTTRIFYHELIHAILHRTSVTEALGRDLEEVICGNVSTALAEILPLSYTKKIQL